MDAIAGYSTSLRYPSIPPSFFQLECSTNCRVYSWAMELVLHGIRLLGIPVLTVNWSIRQKLL